MPQIVIPFNNNLQQFGHTFYKVGTFEDTFARVEKPTVKSFKTSPNRTSVGTQHA